MQQGYTAFVLFKFCLKMQQICPQLQQGYSLVYSSNFALKCTNKFALNCNKATALCTYQILP